MAEVTSLDGTTIAFERTGTGPPLVVVSSALADRSDARRLARRLAEHFTVYNYDRRGRGASGDRKPYSMAAEVDDIESLIDEAGGSAFLFGSSSGAVLALEAASRLGTKVTRLVLFEPPFIVDDSRPPLTTDYVTRLDTLVTAGRGSEAVRHFMSNGMGMPALMVAVMRVVPGWSKMKRMSHTLLYDTEIMGDTQAGNPLPADRWAAADIPTLVLTGEKSEPFLHTGARALAEVLPHAAHGTLKGANHSAVVAAPKALAAALSAFFLPQQLGSASR